MNGERELIARVEAANPQDFAGMMLRPNPDEEKALRAHLGDARFERMRELVLQGNLTRAARPVQGNVVVLHGIMGGELTYYETDADPDHIWVRIFRLIMGAFSRFSMSNQGASLSRIQATGILKRYYGEQLLSLMQGWNTHAFWFDWRLDIDTCADRLELKIAEWFRDDDPVHLVGHSMGGLVARAFIKRHPQRWQSMWDSKTNGKRGGRLVMLGTPNQGSFVIPMLLFGLNDTVKKLALIDVRHSVQDLLDIAKTFTGPYQMMPSLHAPGMDVQKLYEAGTYAPLVLTQNRLDMARKFHDDLAEIIHPDRMLYVAGYDQPTYCGIRDWGRLRSPDGYAVTRRGDGTVPHSLGLLQTPGGRPVPTFYVKDEHGLLPGNHNVIAALDELLLTGTTNMLDKQIPDELRGKEDENTIADARAKLLSTQEAEEARLRELAIPLQTEAKARGDTRDEPPLIRESERELENILTRGFIGAREEKPAADATEIDRDRIATAPIARIKIRAIKGNIQDTGEPDTEGEIPVDAIAVGHYIGVNPVDAEKALDQAISEGLRGKRGATNTELTEPDLLLTQFTERGIIRGELGQPFFLTDPRTRNADGRTKDRLIAIAGLGHVGRFGAPELTVLARELCWSLGRLGKRHLATVLIGSGNGNLPITDAIGAWMEGNQARDS